MAGSATQPAKLAESGGPLYLEYVKTVLERERERSASLQQRGIAVITTSGTLVTLLFGLTTLSTKAESFVLPEMAKPWLRFAMLFFLIAACVGIVTNMTGGIGPIDWDKYLKEASGAWGEQADVVAPKVTGAYIEIVRISLRINRSRSYILTFAFVTEVLAIACVAQALSVVLS